jgi:hypothetical protein
MAATRTLQTLATREEISPFKRASDFFPLDEADYSTEPGFNCFDVLTPFIPDATYC